MTTWPPERPLLVATDLDGSLLDEETYSHDAAREALATLREWGIPLVVASSKTRAEMEQLAPALAADHPVALIVENGGALVLRSDRGRTAPWARQQGGARILALGVPRADLVAALAAMAAETGARLRGFASLTAEEVGGLAGLPLASARLALLREYDEPFLLDGDEGPVVQAAARRGLAVSRGGRFHHLTGATDKGRALLLLLSLCESAGARPFVVALGDSANDASLLRAADRPVAIPRPGGGVDPTLAAAVPAAERAPEPGPAGWNAAVLAILRGERLPSVMDGQVG